MEADLAQVPPAVQDDPFMRAALQQAALGLAHGEQPIGAVVVLDGQIIAAAHTAEVGQRRLLVHAELLALDAADRQPALRGRRADVQLYTTLEPCLMCLGAALSFRLGAIHYALEAPGDGALALIQHWQAHGAHGARSRPAVGDLPRIPTPVERLPRVTQHTAARQPVIDLFAQYIDRQPPGGLRDFALDLLARVQPGGVPPALDHCST